MGKASDMWDDGNTRCVLVWKRKGRRQSGKPWHKWEDNIKMNFKIIVREGID
jgi:hypothetical protein